MWLDTGHFFLPQNTFIDLSQGISLFVFVFIRWEYFFSVLFVYNFKWGGGIPCYLNYNGSHLFWVLSQFYSKAFKTVLPCVVVQLKGLYLTVIFFFLN